MKPDDFQELEPIDLRSSPHANSKRIRVKGAVVWLTLLLSLWTGAVYWYFSRPEADVPERPEQAVESPASLMTPTPTPPPFWVEATPAPPAVFPGRLRLESQPVGATVVRNGQFFGVTPMVLESGPSPEPLWVRSTGYQDQRFDFFVPSGTVVTQRVVLVEDRAALRIDLQPPDATLLVDGVVRVPENGVLLLPMREHLFRAEKPGHVAVELRATPAAAYERVLALHLRLDVPPTPTPVPTPTPFPQRTVNSAGIPMQFIRTPIEGLIGSPRGEQGRRSNETLRSVRLQRSLAMGEREISNREFRLFRPEHDSGSYRHVSLNGDDLPVVQVTWEDAVAFCNWLSEREKLPVAYVRENDAWRLRAPANTGYRLPTEAEWELLAREGKADRRFAWGDRFPPAGDSGNYAGRESRGLLPSVLEAYEDPHAGPGPVGGEPVHAFGLRGMGGNVSEWVNDGYDILPPNPPLAVDPPGPHGKPFWVIKGACWRNSSISDLRIAARGYGKSPTVDIGFRVCRYLE